MTCPVSEWRTCHLFSDGLQGHLFPDATLEAGKNGLTRDTKRDATVPEVRQLKEENADLKRALAESVLANQRLKKSLGL